MTPKNFIHIPKCGGTAIMNAFEINNVWHKRIVNLPKEADYFTVVRNPFDRFVSAFYHHYNIHSEKHMYKDYDAEGNLIYTYSDPNHFLKEVYENKPIAVSMINRYIHFLPMSHFIAIDGKVPPNIEVFYYETFFKENECPVINQCLSHKEELNDFSKEMIRIIYKKDFELFYPLL